MGSATFPVVCGRILELKSVETVLPTYAIADSIFDKGRVVGRIAVRLLSVCAEVRVFVVWRWNASWFKALLSGITKHNLPPLGLDVLFPRLKSLVLDEVPLGHDHDLTPYDTGVPVPFRGGMDTVREKTGAEIFRDIFKERETLGAPLQEVELLNCYGVEGLNEHPGSGGDGPTFEFGLQGSPTIKITSSDSI